MLWQLGSNTQTRHYDHHRLINRVTASLAPDQDLHLHCSMLSILYFTSLSHKFFTLYYCLLLLNSCPCQSSLNTLWTLLTRCTLLLILVTSLLQTSPTKRWRWLYALYRFEIPLPSCSTQAIPHQRGRQTQRDWLTQSARAKPSH
jgi:hypothetical protein